MSCSSGPPRPKWRGTSVRCWRRFPFPPVLPQSSTSASLPKNVNGKVLRRGYRRRT
jgi:hypothetical protein